MAHKYAIFEPEQIELSDNGTEPPDYIRIARYGTNKYTKGEETGEFNFSEDDADAIISESAARGKDIVVDYEHQTLAGGEAPASGWLESLEKREDGLYAKVREWTQKAADYFRAKEYRYFSPVLRLSRTSKSARGLHSVAMTNHPGLHFAPAAFADDATDEELEQNEVSKMDKLLEMLGLVALSDDANKEEEIEKAVQALIEKQTAQAEFLALHDVENLEAATAKINGMVPAEEKAELEQKMKLSAAEKAVELVLSDGKICEAQKSQALKMAMNDLEAFNDLYASAPKLVPLNDDTDAKPADPIENKVVLTDDQKKIAANTGISEEDLIKELEGK